MSTQTQIDRTLAQEYEHVRLPDGEVGVLDVHVEDLGRCMNVQTLFFDTREFEDEHERKMTWVPERFSGLSGYHALEEDIAPDDHITPLRRLPTDERVWIHGVVVARTPASRGLREELEHFDRWAQESVTGRGCYLAKLLHALDTLWD